MRAVMTVEEARKILGEESVKMTDEEVESLIVDLSAIAKWSIAHSVDELKRVQVKGGVL